jgi:hypothetical protein
MFVGFFFLNDFLKSKFNPIYFKQIKIIQNVMFILIIKTKCTNAGFVTIIFGGHNVLCKGFDTFWHGI